MTGYDDSRRQLESEAVWRIIVQIATLHELHQALAHYCKRSVAIRVSCT